MTALLRLAAIRERLRGSLWFMPAIWVTVALAVALGLVEFEQQVTLGGLLGGFAGTPEGARLVLATVAGSTITVTGLTFSLTVVALQIAASQFTPRLLSSFLADRGNQMVLSTFLATFVYTLAVLRAIRSPTEGAPFVPHLAVAIGMVLTLLSVAMLVYFFDHLTQQLRVESVLADLQRDTLDLLERQRPEDPTAATPDLASPPAGATVLRAKRSGHLQAIQLDVLARVAKDHGVVLRLRPTVGAHVTEWTTLAWAWPVDSGDEGTTAIDEEALTSALHHGIHLGRGRTMQHDVAFGIRQLVDITARALSPGVNDPTTAASTVASVAPILAEVAHHGLTPWVRFDDAGCMRVAVPQPGFGELLALACDQPRRYGSAEPAVMIEVLRLLTDVAEVVLRDVDRQAVEREIELTDAAAERADISPDEHERVTSAVRHARAALRDGARASEVGPEPDTVAE